MDSLLSPNPKGEELTANLAADGAPAPGRASVGDIPHKAGECAGHEELTIFEDDKEQPVGPSGKSPSKAEGGVQPLNHQLEEFRQQWQEELEQNPSSQEQTPISRSKQRRGICALSKEEELEEQARDFFLKGMQAEDDRMLNEAIYYYRKALQLVPDIESKLGQVFTHSPRDRVRQDSESSVEGCEIEEDLMTHFEGLRMDDDFLCAPEYEQRMTHISALPVEVMVYILQWVVSSELDLRSLEMFSRACRGFFMCARDEQIWKLACEKVWGANVGKPKKYDGSWRRMIIERPHMLFEGCYISKVTYIRQGEQGLDQFYRPFHMVQYYRYLRFFPEGHVLMLVSPEDPIQSLSKLKHQHTKVPGIFRGGYRQSDSKVTCVLKVVRSEPSITYRYKRHRQAANQNESEMSYCMELKLKPAGKKPNAQLVWQKYSVRTVYKSGEENFSDFTLDKHSFPPLIFSRVKNYMATSSDPLGQSLDN